MPEPDRTTTPPRILCLVPEAPGSGTSAAFLEALDRAAKGAGTVVLYERGDESWRAEDEAHLLGPDDPRLADVDGLDAAAQAAKTAGVGLEVWRSTVPTIGTGVLDAIQHAAITAIVLPAEGSRESIGDRAIGRGDTLADAVEALLEKPLFSEAGADVPLILVDEDGQPVP
jgi:hypothetical protein